MSPNHEIRKAVFPTFATHLNDVSRESGKSTGPWGATISELKSNFKVGTVDTLTLNVNPT